MKNIAILGSTGSIGTNTLDVVKKLKDIKITGLACGRNINILANQIKEFNPRIVSVEDKNTAQNLRNLVSNNNLKIVYGIEGLIEVACDDTTQMVVSSIVGAKGLIPTYEAIKNGKDIALANKEVLVSAGELIIKESIKNKINLIPIDSEHSAVFQSIEGHNKDEISRIILTASGGPFLNKKKSELINVSIKDALNHPNWNMGSRITIDSATLMNKGLEVIEAKWLFDIDYKKIDVLVHPESVIHSMVEYIDGSIISQASVCDMRIPISYALSYPKRAFLDSGHLDLTKFSGLTFQKPDMGTFRCLKLAYNALEEGKSMPCVLNAANEVAREAYLNNLIKFVDIPRIVEEVMIKHKSKEINSIEECLEYDNWARKEASKQLSIIN
jgi:1-deoxy-D-xylulose-5-phosphate reductoisomerase